MTFPAHIHEGDEFATDECCGAPHCDAPLHVHGCWADEFGDRCDDPREHVWEA